MILRKWDKLPDELRVPEVRPYYDVLSRRRGSIALKRVFDFLVSLLMLLILWPFMLLIALAVRLDSPGPALFLQERVTTYGRRFKIWKFRTMVNNAEKLGTQVTVSGDSRVTRVGKLLRSVRLDELPQLVNVLKGDMSFVGTRPEVVKYVEQYTPEMMATLLLPAGVTSEASIRYKDEYKLLSEAEDTDRVYVEEVLPAKMVWNLESVRRFRFLREILTMIRTVLAVLGKDYQ
jgi:lipopolysaccharide/colanic/teichoic acid biosynthesis glycosyltransferase